MNSGSKLSKNNGVATGPQRFWSRPGNLQDQVISITGLGFLPTVHRLVLSWAKRMSHSRAYSMILIILCAKLGTVQAASKPSFRKMLKGTAYVGFIDDELCTEASIKLAEVIGALDSPVTELVEGKDVEEIVHDNGFFYFGKKNQAKTQQGVHKTKVGFHTHIDNLVNKKFPNRKLEKLGFATQRLTINEQKCLVVLGMYRFSTLPTHLEKLGDSPKWSNILATTAKNKLLGMIFPTYERTKDKRYVTTCSNNDNEGMKHIIHTTRFEKSEKPVSGRPTFNAALDLYKKLEQEQTFEYIGISCQFHEDALKSLIKAAVGEDAYVVMKDGNIVATPVPLRVPAVINGVQKSQTYDEDGVFIKRNQDRSLEGLEETIKKVVGADGEVSNDGQKITVEHTGDAFGLFVYCAVYLVFRCSNDRLFPVF